MKVLLVDSDPHPVKSSTFVSVWWGQEIVIGPGQEPKEHGLCDTEMIYPILGPNELLATIKENNLGRFVCDHHIKRYGSPDITTP